MDTLHMLFNAVTVIFIAATMFAAGLGATIPALRAIFTDVPLLLLALLTNMVVIPLLGWGIGALFSLPSAAFIALVLVASSPGGPFGAKLAMVQSGDVVAGAAMQVLLATVGSLTFAPTVNGILTAADLGKDISLDVATLVRTVALLQLVPFVIGLLLRRYAAPTARSWHPTAAAVSNVTFLIVLAGMLLGSWSDVVALLGSSPSSRASCSQPPPSPSGPCWRQVRRCAAPPWAASPQYATWGPLWPRSASPSATSPPSWARLPRSCSAVWQQRSRSPPCSVAAEAAPQHQTTRADLAVRCSGRPGHAGVSAWSTWSCRRLSSGPPGLGKLRGDEESAPAFVGGASVPQVQCRSAAALAHRPGARSRIANAVTCGTSRPAPRAGPARRRPVAPLRAPGRRSPARAPKSRPL